MANRFVSPEQQFINFAGQPYAGGFLFFYISGTSTPTPTYQDEALTIPNSNPVVLDSAGNAGNIFLDPAIVYKVVLCSAPDPATPLTPGPVIWTFDPVIPTDAASGAASSAIISCTANGTNAITLTPINATQQPAAYANYQVFAFVPAITTTGPVSAQVVGSGGALAFFPVFTKNGVQAGANDFVAGSGPYFIAYGSLVAGTTPGFILLNSNTGTGSVSINAATTISNIHNNKILQLGGGVFYAVTFPAGSTLDADFTCTIVNEETAAIGKGIAGLQNANAGSNWTLYPGQNYQVFNDNGTLRIEGGIVQRYKVSGVNLFADAIAGSDDPTIADGLSTGARAYKTLNHMCQALYQNFDHNSSEPRCTANGTFGESVTFAGQPVGTGAFFWNGSAPGGFVMQPASAATPFCMLVADGAIMEISNVTFAGGGLTSPIGIQLHQIAIVDILSGCTFGNFGTGSHMGTDGAGWSLNIDASYTVSGFANNHIGASGTGIVTHAGGVTVTIAGSPTIGTWFKATGAISVSLGAGITWSGAPAAGCTKWAMGPGAAITLSGNAANVPGTLAGQPTTGSAPGASTGWATA